MNKIPRRAAALSDLRSKNDHIPTEKPKEDAAMLSKIAGRKDTFPLLREEALAKLGGEASPRLLENIAGDITDPHTSVRVMAIKQLQMESRGALDAIMRNKKECGEVRNAAMQRLNGLNLLLRRQAKTGTTQAKGP